ncbi:PTS transporter subunit EIIC [Patescibacteria group bacterium]|nr:PTS transporter subunit EIIC [Patescibacteria group bacterium]MBU1935121.1 PTS transporter subunit EIIC [Patescibacteria group bacterium]
MNTKKNPKWLDKLAVVGNKFSNLRIIKAITGGFKFSMPLILIGALIQIVQNVLQIILGEEAAIIGSLGTAYKFTMGIVGLAWAYGIAYADARENKINPNTAGLLAMSLFLILIKPGFADASTETDWFVTTLQIQFERIGAMGSLVAMLAGLVMGEGMSLFIKRGWAISSGKNKNIPEFLVVWFEALIPGLVVILLGWFVTYYLDLDVYVLTTKMMEPIVSAADTLPGLVIYETLAIIGWFLAIHPLASFGWMIPILFSNLIENTELYAAGLAPTLENGFHILNIGTEFGWILLFGSGSFLPLVFFALRSKSEMLKNIGKVSLVPTLFAISEPILFGMPVAFNVTLGIPMIINTALNSAAVYIAMATGFVKIPYIFAFMPFAPAGINGYLYNQDLMGVVLAVVLVVVNGLIYYPFFKVYEKQVLEEENK